MDNRTIIYALCDDDYTLARLQWLLRRDYQVELFNRSKLLFAAIQEQRPDLVILDTSSADIVSDSVIAQTKGVCGTCVSYLLLSGKTRHNLGSLFRCNCIVGQVNLPLIPDQLVSAIRHGLELSRMCQIRANLFNQPLPSDDARVIFSSKSAS